MKVTPPSFSTFWGKLCLGLLSVLVVGLAGLYWKSPTLMTILWYRQPNPQTFRHFPQEAIEANSHPFQFTKAVHPRRDLDTLSVYDGRHQLLSLTDYLRAGKTSAFVVIRNDSILYEYYGPGFSDTATANVFSVAKSVLAILVGVALEEGAIQSLDDRITDYLPELKKNSAFKAITVRHLLTMNSGLAFKRKGGGLLADLFSDEALYYYTDNSKQQLLTSKAASKPGTQWQYKNIDPLLLGWLLEAATHQRLALYTQTKLWQPIGAAYPASWGVDHAGGLANTASSFQTTPLDLAKVGRLFLLAEQSGKTPVVSANWLSQLTHLDQTNNSPPKGWTQTRHQYYWWLPQKEPTGDFAAEGMLGQRLYVDPTTHTIIVHFAGGGAGDYPYRKVTAFLANRPFIYPKQLIR